MAETETSAGPIDSLIADIRLSIKRLKNTQIENLADELRLNVYPTMMAICEQMAEVDDVIQEIVEQQESYLQPELAAQIFKSIAVGGVIVEELKKLFPTFDDVTKKRWVELVTQYERETELAVMGLQDAALDGDGSDDGDDGGGDDGDYADDEAEADETEVE